MNSTYKVPVVRIDEIFKHPNADRLEIIKIQGYQCVVRKEQFHVGELAVYVQPDSIVPITPVWEFVWGFDGGGNKRTTDILEKHRRVTVRKMRKEYSEGILMPLQDFFNTNEISVIQEGDDLAERLGITHYNPPEPLEEQQGERVSKKQSKIFPRSLKGWFYFLSYWLSFGLYDPWGHLGGSNEKAPSNTPPIYDVESFKNFPGVFQEGEDVVITEKIHGANWRGLYQDNHFYVGSRKLWKRPSSTCVWRRAAKQNPWLEEWCREHPGYTLYGEVVPTQKFSGGSIASYGARGDELKVFIFDIRSPDGTWVDLREVRQSEWLLAHELVWVPVIYVGPFNKDKFIHLADGKSELDDHIKEGVVVRSITERHVTGVGRAQLKLISNQYYEMTAST